MTRISFDGRAVRRKEQAYLRSLAQDGTEDNFSTILGIVSLFVFMLALSF